MVLIGLGFIVSEFQTKKKYIEARVFFLIQRLLGNIGAESYQKSKCYKYEKKNLIVGRFVLKLINAIS